MPTKRPVTISEAESIVMEVFWARGALVAEDVFAELERLGKWREPTVKTLLNRLLKKGALRARKDNRRYVYSPVLTRDEWLSSESHGFLDRLFGGRVAPLVSHFSQHKKLSKKDIEDLKRLIRELDDEG
ncbi:MAG TPA: BlaI/MecI/CopY family transcriptional regulator [Steroidobacteraceae bacterium]|nr:BlaI/MecI/CopY family transcriptional regulator [Steroidobacteraceae bacterium]